MDTLHGHVYYWFFPMNARRIAVGILLILQGQFVMALEPVTRLEQYVRTVWTVDRGLPQSTVFGVTQSPDGYIWIATQEGFVRFDGSQFVTYDRSTRPEIISNFSFSIKGTPARFKSIAVAPE